MITFPTPLAEQQQHTVSTATIMGVEPLAPDPLANWYAPAPTANREQHWRHADRSSIPVANPNRAPNPALSVETGLDVGLDVTLVLMLFV